MIYVFFKTECKLKKDTMYSACYIVITYTGKYYFYLILWVIHTSYQ